MAHIDDGKGRRSSNVDINIVPFIDLMSVLIIFLLISAVWTQVSMIQLGSSIYGQKSDDKEVQPPPRAEVPFRLDVKPFGYRIVLGKQTTEIPKKDGQYDFVGLIDELRRIHEIYPEKNDAVVTMADELPYEYLINGMDALLQSGFSQISIATAEAL